MDRRYHALEKGSISEPASLKYLHKDFREMKSIHVLLQMSIKNTSALLSKRFAKNSPSLFLLKQNTLQELLWAGKHLHLQGGKWSIVLFEYYTVSEKKKKLFIIPVEYY